MNANIPKVPPEVAEQAVEWLVELQDDAPTAETLAAFQRWYDGDPSHQKAWRHIEASRARLHRLANPLGADMVRASLQAGTDSQRRNLTKALVVLLFGGVGWVGQRQHWLADERTAVGERKNLRLIDGTQLALNTDTAVELDFMLPDRNIRLLRGEILITTGKPDAVAAPLQVKTHNGIVIPMGTTFMLRQLENRTLVSVFEGAVSISTRQGHSYVFKAGQQGYFDNHQVALPQPLNPADASWQQGMLIAESMRLDDFIAQLNRYRRGVIRIDPKVRDLTISGTYPLKDTQLILNALEATLPINISYVSRYLVTVHPKK